MDTSINPEEMKNLAITLGAPYAQQNELGDTLGRSNELGASLPAPSGPDLSIAPKPARGTLEGDKAERSRMLQTGAGEDQIYGKVTNSSFGQNHPLLGKILGGLGQGAAKLGDIGLSAVAPALAINLPGTEYHHNAQLRQINNQIGSEDKEGQEEAQTQNLQSEIPMHQAMTQHENAQTTALQNPQPKPKEETWELAKDYTGPNGEPVEVEKNSGQMRIAGTTGTAFKRVQPQEKQGNDFEQFYKDYITDNNLPDSAHNRLMARKQYSTANQAPQQSPQALVVGPDGKAQVLHPGDTMAPGSMSATQVGSGNAAGAKETAKEQKATQALDSELGLMKEFAANPSPTNDAAMLMHYIGATKPESMGKIRLNDRELKLFGGTRSSLGDAEALLTKVANGQSLTPTQRQDMVNTMTMIDTASNRGASGASGPKEGDTKVNGSGDKVTYKGGKWVAK